MPFDILSGDSLMRESLLNRLNINIEKQRWKHEIEQFNNDFAQIRYYSD